MVRDNPFPHIVWDSFLDKKTLSFIEEEFPHEESDLWTWKSNDENSIKYMCQDQNLIQQLPNINNLIKPFNKLRMRQFANTAFLPCEFPHVDNYVQSSKSLRGQDGRYPWRQKVYLARDI